jgi:hypothetical protein
MLVIYVKAVTLIPYAYIHENYAIYKGEEGWGCWFGMKTMYNPYVT